MATSGQLAAEILVAAGKNVWLGPVGTTAPTNATTAPAAAFYDIGHIQEDGVVLEGGGSQEDIKAWTAGVPVRSFLSGRELNISFGLLQWNPRTLAAAMGGGVASGAGPYTFTFPADSDILPEYALIIDWVDGATRDARLYVPRVTRSDNTSLTLVRTAPMAMAIAFKKLSSSPPLLFTPDAAFAP